MIDKETSSSPPTDPLVGRVLGGRFAIQRLVAKGGMGRVYRAEQRPLGRTVAVKVLHLDDRNEDDDSFRERFFREASICARLSHPNTVRVFDYGSEDGVYFIVMEFLEGRTLNDLVRREGPLPAHRAISLVRQVCRSLAQAHSQGVVHRDLKPANVFVSRHGEDEFVKVLDFGLVKSMDATSQVTRAGNVLGSPAYMSPEQVLGKEVGPAADIYSLGVILYACLTRTLPFKRDHPMAVLNAHAHAAPPGFAQAAPGLEVPGHVEWVVMRCLEKDPAKRFASMNELDRVLRLCQLELHGNLADFEWTLTDGRLQLPDGITDGVSLSQSTVRNEPNAVAVGDQPSSPTLNMPVQEATPSASVPQPAESTWSQTGVTEQQEPAGRPLRDFVIAAVIVMLLSVVGAVGLGAVGWFLLAPDQAEVAVPEVQAEIAVPAPVDEPPVGQAVEEVAEPEVEQAVEEPQPVEPEPEPVVTKPRSRPKAKPKPRAQPKPQPVAEPDDAAGTVQATDPDEMPSFGEPVAPKEPQPSEEVDDGGSMKPKSDLLDPWADDE